MTIGTTTAPRRPATTRRFAFAFLGNVVVGRLLFLAVLVLLWEFYAQVYADKAMIAPPSAVLAALQSKIFGDPAVLVAIRLSLHELAIAYALSIIVGLAIGIAVGSSNLGRDGVLPIVL